MADVKISGLPASTVPLAGTEVLPIVQSGATKQVSIANVTAGRAVSANSFTPSSSTIPTNGMYLDATNSVSLAANSLKSVTFRQGGIAGLGTTPQSWYVPGDIISAQQIGANAAVFSLFGNQAIFSSNYYLKTGTGNDTYINTGVAMRYRQDGGGHYWDSAPSGTADTTVTFTTKMQIAPSGGVSIGNTTDPGAGGLRASGLIYPQQATTAGAPAYVKGAIYFDTTLNKLRVGGAIDWETITSV